jgi:succinate dehydrogenase hydrophobic anchor subunit
MKKDMIKRLSALALCLILIVMAVLPVAATTPEEDQEYNRKWLGTFWVAYAFLALILPVALGGLGVWLARSETRGKPTYWYGLSIVCGVWLVFSIALMVLLLVI